MARFIHSELKVVSIPSLEAVYVWAQLQQFPFWQFWLKRIGLKEPMLGKN